MLRVPGWFTSSEYKIEQIAFADGTIWESAFITQEAVTIASDANDSLIGTPGNDVIYGFGGNDWLYGNHGDDMLYGGSGSDLIGRRRK
jgi:Ca2+-binding RTX toxin-like protein